MRSFAVVSTLLLAAASSSLAQLTNQVPPPSCLRACLKHVSNCGTCTDDGKSLIGSCLTSTCGPKDVTYAEVYYSETCSSGGYISYEPSTPFYVNVPDTGCSSIACNATSCKPALSRRVVRGDLGRSA